MKKYRNNKQLCVFTGIGLVTVIYMLVLAFNITPYLRGPDACRSAYPVPGVPGWYVVPLAVVTGHCVMVLLWMRKTEVTDNLPVPLFLGFAVLRIPLIL